MDDGSTVALVVSKCKNTCPETRALSLAPLTCPGTGSSHRSFAVSRTRTLAHSLAVSTHHGRPVKSVLRVSPAQ